MDKILVSNAQKFDKHSVDSPISVVCLSPSREQSFVNSSIAYSCHSKSASLLSKSDVDKRRCRSLVSLCLGVLGSHLEDILEQLSELAGLLPADIKMTLMAIARRRGLLCDSVLIALAETSWDLLDVAGSEVTDAGLQRISEICVNLRAIDISRCNRITSKSVCALLQNCHQLEILRCGGTPLSDVAARRCLDFLKPKLHEIEEDNWEELESKEITEGAQSLRWLIWPSIDEDSKYSLSRECPKVILNPPNHRYRDLSVPREALPAQVLDELAVEDIDPETWAVKASATLRLSSATTTQCGILSKAELFRLAFCERDERLAPKRAKNMRPPAYKQT
eukprot:TRINITY_DN22439_c0_g1_i1.p1 TRINITY_DN22439_c0_g1~~TRINITY_DN22439_c0_g1_i1.p1  ORF type:complete len:336 (-),score=54.00 TRINITY_DN22439_c0_g1_i1:22-1029(-)